MLKYNEYLDGLYFTTDDGIIRTGITFSTKFGGYTLPDYCTENFFKHLKTSLIYELNNFISKSGNSELTVLEPEVDYIIEQRYIIEQLESENG